MNRSPYEEFPHIKTSEVTLRKIVETDLDRLFEIYSNENLFQHSPESIVGVAEMFDYHSDVNMITIGYRLHEQFWGQGIATITVNAMTDYLFNRVGVNRIQAFVLPENIKSQNVLQRNKFTQEGIVREGHIWKGKGVVDLVMYSLLKSDTTK
ncbi:GNAT family protein [Paenibacillus sp. FSL R7-0652]|uniref:GNAT family N-acetyltransferase n=1 Tax=Paenibacillus sp. FSL R7-0652 TaxID=2921687 RepID=UPI00315A6CD1